MNAEPGGELEKYPRPSVAVDVALLTVVPGKTSDQLSVLVHRRAEGAGAGEWALPGRFLRRDETLAEAAKTALKQKVDVEGHNPRQLRVFDKQGRDDRGWVLSVAHVELVPADRLPTPLASDSLLAPLVGEPVRAAVPEGRGLFFDHDDIVAAAVHKIRADYHRTADPYGLLGDEFTFYELRRLHEAILGPGTPQKDTFRRLMRPHLEPTGRRRCGTVGAPAEVYRRAPAPGPPPRGQWREIAPDFVGGAWERRLHDDDERDDSS